MNIKWTHAVRVIKGFSYNGEKLGQGRDSVKTILEDNPELMGELEGLIKEKLTS